MTLIGRAATANQGPRLGLLAGQPLVHYHARLALHSPLICRVGGAALPGAARRCPLPARQAVAREARASFTQKTVSFYQINFFKLE